MDIADDAAASSAGAASRHGGALASNGQSNTATQPLWPVGSPLPRPCLRSCTLGLRQPNGGRYRALEVAVRVPCCAVLSDVLRRGPPGPPKALQAPPRRPERVFESADAQECPQQPRPQCPAQPASQPLRRPSPAAMDSFTAQCAKAPGEPAAPCWPCTLPPADKPRTPGLPAGPG